MSAAYWVCTTLVALAFLSGGVANLFAPEAIAGIVELGYPAHFVTLLAVWKILGAIAVVVPGRARLKEWAYAGMIFDLTGGAVAQAVFAAAHGWSGGWHVVTPLVLAAFVVASWALRPPGRRLASA